MKELVAIVGRPNVGKSTLLNRLAGRQVALVADTPGVTRDRIYAGGDLAGREVILVDTGGFDPRPGDSIEQAVVEQAKAAVAEADLILLVADARDGLNPLDSAIADLLRRSSRPVLLLANKVDPGAAGRDWQELQGLGFPTYPISAAHGSGLDEVETRARSILEQNHPAAGETAAEEQAGEEDFRLCLLGRPNVGKSSLANRLLGRQRQIVSDTPGTTRDAVDIVLCRDGISCLLVDTPGVRRRRSVKRQLEQASVLAALRSLERAHVAAVMLDAGEEIGSQDARLVRLAAERGRGIVLVLNKIDLLTGRARAERREQLRHALRFVSWAPLVELSARTGRGTGKLLPQAAAVHGALHDRLTTGQLNRLLASFSESMPPPLVRGRRAKIFYITQAEVAPPTFSVVVSDPQRLPEHYRRYLENSLRRLFPFPGVPLRWIFRPRQNRRPRQRRRRKR